MSIIKEVGHPKRAPQGRNDEDLSERAPPPRSSSPVIGSPPVRAVPIGTPPKQPMSHALNHQVRNRKSSCWVSLPAVISEHVFLSQDLNVAMAPRCAFKVGRTAGVRLRVMAPSLLTPPSVCVCLCRSTIPQRCT